MGLIRSTSFCSSEVSSDTGSASGSDAGASAAVGGLGAGSGAGAGFASASFGAGCSRLGTEVVANPRCTFDFSDGFFLPISS